MTFEQAREKLGSIGQEHLLRYWETLSEEEKERLLLQIEKLNEPLFYKQKELLEVEPTLPEEITPYREFSSKNSSSEIGKKIIANGEVGCLVVAGGQGTRLNFDGPKGMFPVSVIKHKTLFQLLAEKVKAAGNQVGRLLPLAIMTSPENHLMTMNYFIQNNFFGLEPKQVSFFSQSELPFLDQQGNLFLETTSKIAEGPNGNGGSLKQFVEKGFWAAWHQQGVRYLNFTFIDNALAEPYDAELVGCLASQKADLALKCVERMDDQEKVGVLVNTEQGLRVLEYTEMPPQEFTATQNGRLKHSGANLSLFCFTMDFVKKVAQESMPLHKAFKSVKSIEGKKMAWKFEEFIFDVMNFSNKIKAILSHRENCFAPLKNASGRDSVEDVQRALQNLDTKAWEKVTGTPAPERPFELPAEFHYPTKELIAKWKGKNFPDKPYVVD